VRGKPTQAAAAVFDEPQSRRVREVARLFLRLGLTAFGGPAAHIAMMRTDVVERRRWLTSGEFLDLLGATNLIPGPNSTEMAIHIGYRRAGWRGLVAAGLCFIAPAALLTFALAWGYVRFGSVPQARAILYGVKPVIIAVVIQAIWNLGKSALKTKILTALAAACLLGAFLGLNELVILLAAGAMMTALDSAQRKPPAVGAFQLTPAVLGALGMHAAAFSPLKLFLVFLKIGAILYGSGYVLLAFVRADFVDGLHWITEQQLIDAVAVGQLTPGPVLSTATFIGYVIGGGAGATLATLGIFLPSFFFVAASGALIPRIRTSKGAAAFLDGVNVASLSLMVAVTWNLGTAALVDAATVVLSAASAVLLLRWKVNSAWLVLGGAVASLALHRS
jgi:chromate transporter